MKEYKTIDLELNEAQEIIFNAIKNEGAMAERERIIALLQGMDYSEGKIAHKNNPSGVCRICRAIALIEGDDKW